MITTDTLLKLIQKAEIPILQELYGMDANLLKKTRSSYIALIRQFQSLFCHPNARLFSSPGRTEISGNHTDHNHGRVLAGAINLDNIAIAAPNDSKWVRIHSKGYPQLLVDLSRTKPQSREKYTSQALIRGIGARFGQLGYEVGGFDACIDGRVPKGSGLSSSASFEVLIATIFNSLFHHGKVDPIRIAQIGQFAENNYFEKPCGLMDQTACSVGGLVTIDFQDPLRARVKKLNLDFQSTGFSLVITDTGGHHADLTDEYASVAGEMKSVAAALGKKVLRSVRSAQLMHRLPAVRKKTGDRALLRAFHFLEENERVGRQVDALENNNIPGFLQEVIASGFSSFMYNQNIFTTQNPREQGVALGLLLSERILKDRGAWRVHGGGFAGTIQAFVPQSLLGTFIATMEKTFGKGSCYPLCIRNAGSIALDF